MTYWCLEWRGVSNIHISQWSDETDKSRPVLSIWITLFKTTIVYVIHILIFPTYWSFRWDSRFKSHSFENFEYSSQKVSDWDKASVSSCCWDRKSYDHLIKLKSEYGGSLSWVLPFLETGTYFFLISFSIKLIIYCT